ncbi:MAG: YggS family pyridoxal phosphate-dependent enzyme [Gemmatimonadetes bacterium]|nr:YggS family pyridoxal phosphate-dependent enzyme [Gemmatimonadota bacterium]
MPFAALADNLARVRAEIARVQAGEGWRHDVRVVAVTKGHPVEAMHAAYRVGLRDIGENRVQEGLEKREAAGAVPVRWHLIGHLQTNKAKHVPGVFALVHSVDSWRVAEALAAAARTAAERGGETEPSKLAVLLQVNVAGEGQKSGCGPGEAPELAARIAALPELALQGLMTMAPLTDDERVQRRVFGDLRQLRERISSSGLPLPELSMGMSGDYAAAVAEGATMLRLGTVLFGERAP